MFWLPRFYLTARSDISKRVFLQPVNNTEETEVHKIYQMLAWRLQWRLFGVLGSFGVLVWLQPGTV